MKSATVLIKIFIGLMVFSGLIQLVLVNNSCSAGSDISKLEHEKIALDSDILDLNNRLAAANSLTAIKDQASRLGLSSVGANFEYLSDKTVAANLNATP